MVPLPHRMSSAGQYLSQPQQTRSGFLGLNGSLGAGFAPAAVKASWSVEAMFYVMVSRSRLNDYDLGHT